MYTQNLHFICIKQLFFRKKKKKKKKKINSNYKGKNSPETFGLLIKIVFYKKFVFIYILYNMNVSVLDRYDIFRTISSNSMLQQVFSFSGSPRINIKNDTKDLFFL